MKQFEDVTLTWAGVDYTIPADGMMRAIALIEQHVSLEDLNLTRDINGNARLKRSAIASAYASVLRYAGAKVSDEDVYAGMFKMNVANTTALAVQSLALMMVPREAIEQAEKAMAEGKPVPGNPNRRARRAAGSSKKRTGSRAVQKSKAASV